MTPTTTPTPASDEPTVALGDGLVLPAVSLGTWAMDDAEAERSVAGAADQGYRHVDTAMRYHNEFGVGKGLARAREAGLRVGVTSKLRGGDQGHESTKRAFHATRHHLGVDVVDLYLVHWPLPRLDRYVESFRAMQELRDDGLIASIGVSNFEPAHLRRLVEETGEVPSVNQVEMHPGLNQEQVRAVCAELGVHVQAYQPLARGKVLDHPAIVAATEAHGVTSGQVALRWLWQHGVSSCPKSADAARRRANLDIASFALSDAEMAAIDAMEQERLGAHPDEHEEF